MKNIVVITGSCRKEGNSELLAKAFIEGAGEAGHKVYLFDTGRKKLSCCIACETCFSTGQACSHADDFNELAPYLENADTLVFCTPLYWYTFPGKIKIVIDKMYSFLVGKRKFKITETALIVCAYARELKYYDGIVKTFEIIAESENWKNAGTLIVPGVNRIGAVKKTDGLARAKEFGLRI